MENVSAGEQINYNKSFLNGTDLNLQIYLERNLGPRHLDTPTLVILTTVYVAIFLSGTVGNVCTCIVIARNRHMHTATNYYLFNLSVSDLATLILGTYFIITDQLILNFRLFTAPTSLERIKSFEYTCIINTVY